MASFGSVVLAAVVLCAAVHAGAAARSVDEFKPPGFCGDKNCPRFSDEGKKEGYSIRKYEEAQWAVTTVEGSKLELAVTQGYARLAKYAAGENEHKENIEATTPTLYFVQPSRDMQSIEKNVTVALYLPYYYQDGHEVPKPIDTSEISLFTAEAGTRFVRSFQGFATEGTVTRELRALVALLDGDKLDYNLDGRLEVAVYDPATKLINRYNEVSVGAGKPSVLTRGGQRGRKERAQSA